MHPYSKLEVYWAELMTGLLGFSADTPTSSFGGEGLVSGIELREALEAG